MTKPTKTTPRKRKLTNIELDSNHKKTLSRLLLFTGWTKKAVFQAALDNLEKNRHVIVADRINEGGAL